MFFFFILGNYYFQVSFSLEVILYLTDQTNSKRWDIIASIECFMLFN